MIVSIQQKYTYFETILQVCQVSVFESLYTQFYHPDNTYILLKNMNA